MIGASWSYRHEADYSDFARLDVTFREATEAQPIFVFENSFLMGVERLIAQIDTYRAAGEGLSTHLLPRWRQGRLCAAVLRVYGVLHRGVFEAGFIHGNNVTVGR